MKRHQSKQISCLEDNRENENKMAELRQIYAALVVNILGISNGISAGWTSPVEPILSAPNNPIRAQPITEETFSWASSVLYLGGLVGTFVWNDLADRYGRKFNGYAIAATQIASWFGVIIADSPAYLIIARFIMGIGGAGIIVHSQLYTSETASFKLKGPLCGLISISMNVGLLLVSVLGYYSSYQALNFVCLAVPILFCGLFVFLPESPLYLMNKNRGQEAKDALTWYRRSEYDVEVELASISGNIGSEHTDKVAYSELIRNRENLRATIIATVLLVGQQLSGRSVIMAYLVDLFSLTQTSVSPHVSSIIANVLQLAVSCSSNFVTEAVGKKRLLCGTYLGSCLACLALSSFCLINPSADLDYVRWIPTVSVIMFLVCGNLGVLPVPYMMLPHLFPPRIFNNGLFVSLFVSIFTSFATVKVFPALKRLCGNAGSISVFAGFNLLLVLFVSVYVQEPKGEESRKNEELGKSPVQELKM